MEILDISGCQEVKRGKRIVRGSSADSRAAESREPGAERKKKRKRDITKLKRENTVILNQSAKPCCLCLLSFLLIQEPS